MAKRKIIQIAAAESSRGDIDGVVDGDAELFTLCDDGSLWRLCWSGKWEWNEMPDIPQDEE